MAWKELGTLPEEMLRNHEKKYGTFNDFPPGWTSIDEKEFAQSAFFTYSPEIVEHRQMYRYTFDETKQHHGAIVDARLFFMPDGNGVAIGADYWKGSVKYYKFTACEHVWGPLKDKSVGLRYSCMNVQQCVKCDYIWQFDSSG